MLVICRSFYLHVPDHKPTTSIMYFSSFLLHPFFSVCIPPSLVNDDEAEQRFGRHNCGSTFAMFMNGIRLGEVMRLVGQVSDDGILLL